MTEKPLTASERRMLVHNPAAETEIMEGRSRVERRRLEQEREREADREKKFAGKLATRADVVKILELYFGRKILPLAANVDANSAAIAYLTAPWWKRRVIDCRRFCRWLTHWLDQKGVRFFRIKEDQPPKQGEKDEAPTNQD